MITEDQIQSILRGLNLSHVSMNADGIVRFTVRGTPVEEPASVFEEFLRLRPTMSQSSRTSLFFSGYFEQAVELHGHRPLLYRSLDSEGTTLEHAQSGLKVELGPISPKFAMHLTDSDKMDPELRGFILLRRPGRESVSLSEAFGRLLSVKVVAPHGYTSGSNLKLMRDIAEASLFHFAFGMGIGIVAVKSWERTLRSVRIKAKESVQFPLRSYNNELVACYQMAIGGDSLILSYLALYKVLEYFFPSASELRLHEKIKEQLTAPDFSHTKASRLRDLTKLIRKFDQKMDEKRMLQTVLEHYIDRDALRLWLDEFDKTNSGHFTSAKDLFGESQKIDTSDDQIFPTVSSRIYHVRNALVHNKEGEEARFIPFSGQEKSLERETLTSDNMNCRLATVCLSTP